MVLHNYSKAENYVPNMLENIGINYLKNIMIKYMAKEYFGKAVLTRIYFNDDIQEAKLYINKYKNKDKSFEDSNIYILCKDFISLIEHGENDKLNNAVQKYKEICGIDEYLTFILDNIIDRENQKKKLKDKENKNTPNKFELKGVLSISINENNKYVFFGKSPIDDKWYLYNDENVNDIDEYQVIDSNQSYIPCILLYKSC